MPTKSKSKPVAKKATAVKPKATKKVAKRK